MRAARPSTANHGDTFKAKADFSDQQRLWQGNLCLDLPLVIHVVDRMRDQTVAAPFGRQPEAARAIQRDAFEIQLLRRIARPRYQQ